MFKELFDKKKLIIFDLDGTVIKSNKVWDMAFADVAKAVQADIFTLGTSGDTVAQRWEHVLKANAIPTPRSRPELIELTNNAFVRYLDELELTEGFWPFVAELKLMKNLKLALVTNTARTVTDRVIAKFEFKEVFDLVLCGDEVKHPKPNAEIYKKTLMHFKVSSQEALAFEDSLTGCISAAKAGIKIICVWDGETPQRKFPDEVVDFTGDFTPFPGELETTYYEDIMQMAKEQEQVEKNSSPIVK